MAGQTPEGQEQRPYPAEDEIDLADLVAVLVRWRWLIIGGTAGVLVLALVYSLLLPAKYAVEGYLSVGKVGGSYIEDPQTVANRLATLAKVQASQKASQGGEIGFSVEKDLSFQAVGGGMVRVEIAEAPKTRTVTSFLANTLNQVVEDHEAEIKRERNQLKQEILAYRAEKSDLESRKKTLNQQLAQNAEGGSSVAVLQNMLSGLRSQIQNLHLKIQRTQDQLDHLKPTKVAFTPTFSEEAVAPNSRLHAALGLVLGVFLSVFLAFLAEFWANNRDRIMAEARE